MRLALFFYTVVLIALAGCAPTVTTRLVPTCLPMVTYTPTSQKALANANRALENAAPEVREPIRAAITEYVTLRAANRAACASH